MEKEILNYERYEVEGNMNLPSGESLGYGDEILIVNEKVYVKEWCSDKSQLVCTGDDPKFIRSNSYIFILQ